ncbi:(R)-1-hydroxy-2-aminoethylphosphonate ammonia-lyase [Oceanidesulfovibrio marinus]|uniref:Aspartate aminotransferase family protein n=1 Tax=Oceanidesulfovibrio marinus TaxID=370038 RepID=A0ABX6NIQ3_9BACT|nr:aspartate aminotransferase family protein [Oceanidesulfovibrio marinus]QJT09575.1 aspartate aminotransferase family protein [Oceanidesulfovibrio marinus]
MRNKADRPDTGLPPGEGDVNQSPYRAAWQERLGPDARALLAEDERYFLRQSLSTPCLNALAGASGSRIADMDGREYLDFHGNSVHQLGFAHPAVVAALQHQLEELSFSPRRYANRAAVNLAKALVESAPEPLGKALFAPGGTLAVGMALKLARYATGRFKTVSFWDSFHGASLDAVSIGGEALFRQGVGPLLPGAVHVPPPEPGRCIHPKETDCGRCGLACAEHLEYVMAHEGDVAAVIAEPIRCTTASPPPPGFWPAVREICNRHGALLIFDETAVCLGRTGRLFACEHFGADPDILVLGKGLGGGVFPMAAMLARPELDVAPQAALGHYTHEKSPIGAACGLAVLETIEREDLVTRSAESGAYLLERLQAMRNDPRLDAVITDIRGLGLTLAVELRHPDGKEAARDLADRVMYACLERGLSFKTSHGVVLTLTPPLNIDTQDLDLAADIVAAGLAHALDHPTA